MSYNIVIFFVNGDLDFIFKARWHDNFVAITVVELRLKMVQGHPRYKRKLWTVGITVTLIYDVQVVQLIFVG